MQTYGLDSMYAYVYNCAFRFVSHGIIASFSLRRISCFIETEKKKENMHIS